MALEKPPCYLLSDLFYGEELDGRSEPDREERENKAKAICSGCFYMLACLERAMVWGEKFGVWGGMGESERRRFRAHMRDEGYEKVPEGTEFWATWNSFLEVQQRESEGEEPVSNTVKYCSSCKLPKNPLRDFYHNANGRQRPECKSCHAERAKERKQRRRSA